MEGQNYKVEGKNRIKAIIVLLLSTRGTRVNTTENKF